MRCSQFHDLVAAFFAAGARFGVVPCLRATRLQPIDVRDVAMALLDAAGGPLGAAAPRGPETRHGGHAAHTVCGPEIRSMAELAAVWARAERSTGRVLEIPVPGRSGRLLAEGGNLVPDAPRGTITFEQWLEERHPPTPGR